MPNTTDTTTTDEAEVGSLVTRTNLALASHRNVGDSTGEAPSVARAIMRGDATHEDRKAHLTRALIAAGLVEGSPLILATPTVTLTPGRMEALRLIAEGLSTTEIAERMFLTLSTTAKHVGNMRRVLGAASRVEAVVEAVRQGLLPPVPAPAGRPASTPSPRVRCSAEGCGKRTAHPSGACPDHR